MAGDFAFQPYIVHNKVVVVYEHRLFMDAVHHFTCFVKLRTLEK
jgi:hypothetical protein